MEIKNMIYDEGELPITIKDPCEMTISFKPLKKKNPKCIKIGYGYVAPIVGLVNKTKSVDTDVKENDLVLSFGELKERLKTGTILTEEQSEYCKEHKVVDLVISRNYIPRFIQILQNYYDGKYNGLFKEGTKIE